MSAIAVIFNLDGSPVAESQVKAMTDAVPHRGPDGIGTWTAGPVGLGSNLLKSTAEAEFEKLPGVSSDGKHAIAFDGRIDNRNELITAVTDKAPWESLPDSALMLAAYRTWGKRCVDHVAGDFAFAIWDATEHELFCGRDPIGIRQLYYYSDGKRFIAATEISQILTQVNPKLDSVSLTQFLISQGSSPDSTFYEGIKKLPGGCTLSVTASGPLVDIYWNPDPSELLILKDDREYEVRFLELFEDAVRSRLRSTSPVAVSLSGGMDSSSILALAEHMRKNPSPGQDALPEVWYYSNIYTGMEDVDESEWVRSTVDMYGTHGKMIESAHLGEEDARSQAPPGHHPGPLVAPHEASHRRLFSDVKNDGCRTVLTGLGGDEVFSVGFGYLTDLVRSFDIRSIRREWRYFSRDIWMSAGKGVLGSFVPFVNRNGKDQSAPWLDSKSLEAAHEAANDQKYDSRHFKSHHLRDVESWIQGRGSLPGYSWVDMTTAEYQLEPRHPFMDRRIAEFLASVPANVKYRYGYNKRVLRRAMKGIMPENVRNRRYKTNFSSLFDETAGVNQASRYSELLSSPMLADIGIVNAVSLQEAWNDYQADPGRADNDRRSALWMAITLEQWLRQNMVDEGK